MPAIPAQLYNLLSSDEPETKRAGFLVRALRAVQAARLRQAEREVARFIEGRGRRITDTLEREIERHII